MSKKSGGLFAVLTLLAAGAAAIFFSKEKNRELAKSEIKKVATKVKKVRKDLKDKKVVQNLERRGKKLASKVVKAATSETTKREVKKVVARAKKGVKKVAKKLASKKKK